MARLLSDFLEQQGFDPFLDVDGLTSGHFDKQILLEIEARPHFLLVCTPGALDRCNQEGDWVRLEVGHAILTRRNVVPVLAQGFVWPSKASLPRDIADIGAHHAFEYSHTHWRNTRQKLVERLVPLVVRDSRPPADYSGASGSCGTAGSVFTNDYAVLAAVLDDLQRAQRIDREPICWEFLELSAPFVRDLWDSAAFWNARLRCALEVDCPGIGGAAARRAGELAAMLPQEHPLRVALVAADRRRWRHQPPPGRDWKVWDSQPHHASAEGRDAETVFREAIKAIEASRDETSDKPRALLLGTLKMLCELGFEPAVIYLSDSLLAGHLGAGESAGAVELLRSLANGGNEFARLSLGKFLAHRGDPESLPLLEECERRGSLEALELLAAYGSQLRYASAEQRKEWARSLDRAIDLRNIGEFRLALQKFTELASELARISEPRPSEYWAVLYSRALTYEALQLPTLAKQDLERCAPFYPLAAERLLRFK